MIMEYLKDNQLKSVEIVCDCGSDKFLKERNIDNPVPSIRNEYKCSCCGQWFQFPLHWIEIHK